MKEEKANVSNRDLYQQIRLSHLNKEVLAALSFQKGDKVVCYRRQKVYSQRK